MGIWTSKRGDEFFIMGEFDMITGPMLIGTILNVFMLGIMVQQCHIYFVSYPSDRAWMKIMVTFILLVDVANSAFDTAFTYDYTITKSGQVSEIHKTVWLFSTGPVTTVILSSTVQLFYAWRLKNLTGKMWLSLIIDFCVCIQLLGGITAAIISAILREFVQSPRFKVIVTVWLVMASMIDISITAILVWYLRRRKTGFVDIDDIVTRIIRLTVQTGAATTACSIIALVLYLACENTLHLIFGIPLSKLYTVSLMSSLNARRRKPEVSHEGLNRSLACKQEISGTSTVLIICRHAPSVVPGQMSQPIPSSVSYINHPPTPGLERRRTEPNPTGFTQDLADTNIPDVNWHDV